MVTLICPVRGCGRNLHRSAKLMSCPSGHSFDIAKSGYCNLLQPQDRRSLNPGDTKEMVAARRRFLDRGFGAPLADALQRTIASISLYPDFSILDAGCGEGYFLSSLLSTAARARACGVDISALAVDAAARRYPHIHWLVANADRSLPFADGCFDVIMSVTARKNSAEFFRLLSTAGRLLIVVPGGDDMIELREAVLGEGHRMEKKESTVAHFSSHFTLTREEKVRDTVDMDAAALHDAFAMTYRGASRQGQERLARIARLDVTLSYDLLVFEPLPQKQ